MGDSSGSSETSLDSSDVDSDDGAIKYAFAADAVKEEDDKGNPSCF